MSDQPHGVLRADVDGRAVRFERRYATTPDDLWRAVTDPDRLARWLAPVSGDLNEGGRVQVHFDDAIADFEVVTCDPPARLVVRWWHTPERATTVSGDVSATDTGAMLVLEHRGLREEEAAGYSAGWDAYLQGLDPAARLAPWDERFEVALTRYREQAAAQVS